MRHHLTSLLIFLTLVSCQQVKKEASVVSGQNISTKNIDELVGKDYLIDEQHSYVGFRIKYFGSSNVRGRFDKFNGTAFYDSLTGFVSVNMIIDVNSINTGQTTRDGDLKEGEWFESAKYPSIGFRSTTVETTKSGFNLKGLLTIKGIQREVVVPFDQPTAITKDWAGNDQVDFTGTFKINRRDYKVEGASTWNKIMENGFTQLSEEVEIELEIHARRADYSIRKLRKDARLFDSTAFNVMSEIRMVGFEKSMIKLEKLSNQNDNTFAILSDVGYALLSEGRYENARTVFNLLIKLFPDKYTYNNQIGVSYLKEGNTNDAQTYFRKTLLSDSSNTKAIEYLNLVRVQ